MKQRREIYAIDYAIVEFVSAIDSLLRLAIGTNPAITHIAGGLNVDTEKVSDNEIRVRIQPVSWPVNSQLFARFQRMDGSWKAFEGAFYAQHLPPRFRNIDFDCYWSPMGCYKFRGKGDENEKAISRLYALHPATKS